MSGFGSCCRLNHQDVYLEYATSISFVRLYPRPCFFISYKDGTQEEFFVSEKDTSEKVESEAKNGHKVSERELIKWKLSVLIRERRWLNQCWLRQKKTRRDSLKVKAIK